MWLTNRDNIMNTHILKRINEAKDVSVYKKLLTVLTQYSEKFPMTGIDSMLDRVAEKGKSVLPTDKRALEIVDYVLSLNSFSAAVSALMNTRFSDLPAELKPLANIDKTCQLAFWCVDGQPSDRVKDLICFNQETKTGFFCDSNGKKVELLTTTED